MTLDALLAKLKQEHGDGWIEYTLVRWAQLFDKANLFHTSDDEHEEYGVLSEWVRNMVAAGVAATEQPAATPLWSNERIDRECTTSSDDGGYTEYDVMHAYDVHRMRDEYEAALRRATEQPAAWEPVRSEKIGGLTIGNDGAFVWLDDDDDYYLTFPDDIRLCRLVQQPAAGAE